MKTQKFVTFVKKNMKINMIKIKKYCKTRDHCHYTGEYRGNLKHNVPKEIAIVFHNGSNCDIILS